MFPSVIITEIFEEMKNGNPFASGVIPSPLSTKDWTVPAAPGAVETFTHPAVRKIPVRSQQGGTCVGNSITTAMTYLQYVEKNEAINFSGEELNARVIGRNFVGDGIWPRDGLDEAMKRGLPADKGIYFPAGYAQVDQRNVDAIKSAMSTPKTMLTGSFWFYGFGSGEPGFGEQPNVYYDPKIRPENNKGYHQMTLVAYDSQGVTIQNSWGVEWGVGGFAKLSWNYIINDCGELWAITDSPDTAGGYVQTYVPPTQTKFRACRMVGTQAVYAIYENGRIWVQSLADAKYMGIDMSKVQDLPRTDLVWSLPVIGPDAALIYR